MEEVLANSFRDFHVRGFDYLCLKRSETETLKLYFFDGDVSKLPEVVNPHDHRYDFKTYVVTGRSQNVWFERASEPAIKAGQSRTYARFAYDTPLNGGIGFTHVGEEELVEVGRSSFQAGQWYQMGFREIHTIRMLQNETVLGLVQYADQVTDRPTSTFTRGKRAPSIEGVYRRFKADEVTSLVERLRERAPGIRVPEIV